MIVLILLLSSQIYGFTKGAPETVQKFLRQVFLFFFFFEKKHHLLFHKTPANYEETYKFFSRQGFRVIALAYKNLSNTLTSQITQDQVSFFLKKIIDRSPL